MGTNIAEVVWLDAGDIHPGRRMRAVARLAWWHNMAMVGRVTIHDPGTRRFTYEIVDAGPARMVTEFRVEPDNDGALVTMEGASEAPSLLLRVTGPLIERLYARMLKPQAAHLKAILEGGADTGRSIGAEDTH